MIVQPDFPEHWKTRRLVEITGDESAPLAVIRLWAHCQHNRRWMFPGMTQSQLASICHWNDRKPAFACALFLMFFGGATLSAPATNDAPACPALASPTRPWTYWWRWAARWTR